MANPPPSKPSSDSPYGESHLSVQVAKHCVLIFVIGVSAISWLANYLVNLASQGDPAFFSVGVSITAMGPIAMAVALRKWIGQGWEDAGLKLRLVASKRWYAFAALYTPLLIALIGAIAVTTGAAKVQPDHAVAINTMLITFGVSLGPMLFASVCEEFGWRGYLEPTLWSVNQRIVLNHVFVGIVWGMWHFPILVFAPSNEVGPLQLSTVILGSVALAIIYGQMRLRSASVWPCVVLHAVSNAAFIAIGNSGLLRFNPDVTNVISFSSTSFTIVAAWVTTSVLVLALNKKGVRFIFALQK